MSSAPSPEAIARDATWLVQALDPSAGMARLVAMNGQTYRAASFLDDRLMLRSVDSQIVPWPDVEAATERNLRTDARWIFHIGHVGSTLVSRLLGEIAGVLAIREPRLLRDLAMAPPDVRDRYLRSVPKLMSRSFGPGETSCVKATSYASEIAVDLVPPGERAFLMYARPRNYIASILAGENSLKELVSLGESRAQRLANREIVLPTPINDAARAAAAWACEMTSLEAAAEVMPDRQLRWGDFDQMLGDMSTGLRTVASFFGFECDPGKLDAIARGPLIRRYSKALEYEYSADLRQELIDDAVRRQSSAIDDALAMLERASEKSALLKRAWERALPEK